MSPLFSKLTVVSIAVFSLASSIHAAPVQEVKIGFAGPLSGPSDRIGKDLENGANLAISDVNRSHPKIGGRAVTFTLVSEDDQSDPRTAVTVAQRLVDAGVVGVVGHWNTGTSIPASRIYNTAGIPEIAPASTGHQYTQQGYATAFRAMQYVNLKEGGVNGVKLTWSECETEYVVEKGVECYERLKKGKNGAPAAATNPLSVGIAYATLERSTADKLPLITINHGRTDSTDGSVFPYVFPLQLNPYSEVSAIINYIGQKSGGLDKLKGKKIAVLYHGSPYGKETNPILQLLAKKYGFQLTLLEVPHPGNEQQSQWLTIRQQKPDWVILRGWGVMNPVALKTAQKTGYPADHIIGNIWSNSEEDAAPAGTAAKGFISITTHPSGTQFPVLQGIKKYVIDTGKGNLADPKRFGTVYYNLGVVNGILNVEAVRLAQAKFGKKPLTGEQVRWGFEHLQFNDKRLKQVGALGLLQPLQLSCSDHAGPPKARLLDHTK